MSKEQFHELSDYIVEYFNGLEKKLSCEEKRIKNYYRHSRAWE